MEDHYKYEFNRILNFVILLLSVIAIILLVRTMRAEYFYEVNDKNKDL